MKTKIVSSILIASMLLYIGCYSTETLTKQKIAAQNEPTDITVVMKDGRQFVFEAGRYSIAQDSLSGFGIRIDPNAMWKTGGLIVHEPFVGALPLAEVSSIETKEFSVGKTILFVTGVGFVIAMVVIGASFSKESWFEGGK